MMGDIDQYIQDKCEDAATHAVRMTLHRMTTLPRKVQELMPFDICTDKDMDRAITIQEKARKMLRRSRNVSVTFEED